jgi:hypothetical protein
MTGWQRYELFRQNAEAINADKHPAEPLLSHGSERWLQLGSVPRGQHPQL